MFQKRRTCKFIYNDDEQAGLSFFIIEHVKKYVLYEKWYFYIVGLYILSDDKEQIYSSLSFGLFWIKKNNYEYDWVVWVIYFVIWFI